MIHGSGGGEGCGEGRDRSEASDFIQWSRGALLRLRLRLLLLMLLLRLVKRVELLASSTS